MRLLTPTRFGARPLRRSSRPHHPARLAVVVALAAILGPLGALAPGRARADGTDGKVAGMVMSHLGQSESDPTAMSRVRQDGVNTVSLFVWWWTDSPTSSTVRPYAGTESDADLEAQIAAARANGLRVILDPIFYCGTCQGGWRGVMTPTDVPAFFSSYRSFIDHYAQLAQAQGVWLLFVGSEMTDLEGETAQWQAVVSSARSYYSGLVAYQQNWDVVARPQFLSSVDVVGVSAYFPLDDAQEPTVGQLVSDWSDSRASAYRGRNWVGDLTHLANITGKPILFGEAGYMDSVFAARQPFLNAYEGDDPQLQADLYQALLQTFSGYSWWMGVSWWEWSDSPSDLHRTPMGKTAETLLQKWYAQGWRPAAAPAGSTGAGTGASGGTAAGPTSSTMAPPAARPAPAGSPAPVLRVSPDAAAGRASGSPLPGPGGIPNPGARPSGPAGGTTGPASGFGLTPGDGGPGEGAPGSGSGSAGPTGGHGSPSHASLRSALADAALRAGSARSREGRATGVEAEDMWRLAALLLLAAIGCAVPLAAVRRHPPWEIRTVRRRAVIREATARNEAAWAAQRRRLRGG